MSNATRGKVHAICPDGQHRAILLALPSDSLAEEAATEKPLRTLPGAYWTYKDLIQIEAASLASVPACCMA